MSIQTRYLIFANKYKSTAWYLAIFVIIIHILSITSLRLAIAKEEDHAQIITDKTIYASCENVLINLSLIPQDAIDVELYTELSEEKPQLNQSDGRFQLVAL